MSVTLLPLWPCGQGPTRVGQPDHKSGIKLSPARRRQRPGRGSGRLAGRPAERSDRRRAGAAGKQAAGHAGARERASRFARCGHRGLSAAHRGRARRRAWSRRHRRRRGARGVPGRRPGGGARCPACRAVRWSARRGHLRCAARGPCPDRPDARRPDLAAFPRAAWVRAERSVLGELSASNFGYGDPRGSAVLRLAVARWLARNRGIRVDPVEVVVVAGTSTPRRSRSTAAACASTLCATAAPQRLCSPRRTSSPPASCSTAEDAVS